MNKYAVKASTGTPICFNYIYIQVDMNPQEWNLLNPQYV